MTNCRMKFWPVAALVVVLLPVAASSAAQSTTVFGKKLLVRDNAFDPSKRQVLFEATDHRIDTTKGAGIDPTTDGATLQIYNANGSGESVCIDLPKQDWVARGRGPNVTYKYKDTRGGPCKTAVAKDGKSLNVSCRATHAPLSYSLDEPRQGSMAVRFMSGTTTYCAVFGGQIIRDSGTTAPFARGKGRFWAKDAPALVECAPAPEPCSPVSTQTPTPTRTPTRTATPTVTAAPTPIPLCGDGLVEGNEECDPPADGSCPGQCSLCRCPGAEPDDATIRIAYVVPSNRSPQPLAVENLQAMLPALHGWWCEQMDRYGFGPQSFRYEREADGLTPVVHTIAVDQTDDYLRADIFNRTSDAAAVSGVPVWTPGQVWLLVPGAHAQQPDSSVLGGVALGGSFGSGLSPGVAMVAAHFHMIGSLPDALWDDTPYQGLVFPEIGPVPAVRDVFMPWFELGTISSLNSSHLGGAMHEIGHALGLQHDARNDGNFHGNLMYNGARGMRGALLPNRYPEDDTNLTYAAALSLRYSRYLEPCDLVPPAVATSPVLPRTIGDDTPPTLTVSTSGTVNPTNGLVEISFQTADAGGLSSAVLFRNGETEGEMPLSGTSASGTFRTERYDAGVANSWVIWTYDRNGNHSEVARSIVPAAGSNQAPRPWFRVTPSVAAAGEAIVLDASASFDPDGDTTLRVEWDLNGDGVYDTAPTTVRTLSTTFSTAGTRLIRLRMTDSRGAQVVLTPIAVRISEP